MTAVRKPRYQNHDPFNAILREDWIKSIALSPDSFEAFLYRPVDQSTSDDSESNYEEETVTELDTNQDTLTYSNPELVPVLDCPGEQESFFMMDDNGDNLGEGPDPLLLRIGSTHVPTGTVLEWDEETASGTRTVWWYVHKAMGYGAAQVGVIYVCIPMRDFNQAPATE
ncbi:hypothetical protein [Vibrio marisflavi]|uniref:Uncharacterized protein n=1 Tax=Vibrio marisflavi CECT 7928 TaxID=634439 RepID=A0ABM9AA84_9VIBR|nr:hypothetical protein [Vibrio marisflavi]CAH0543009.1 hypothetical protein VMF7928_04358 [Vibrio marisflavi CECT 7928]